MKEYTKLHKQGNFQGNDFNEGELDILCELIDKTSSSSLLDYGCGKAYKYTKKKYHTYMGIDDLYLYDPFVEQYSTLIDHPVDIVVCTDVLEHIPEEDITDTLKTIFSKARKCVFLSISCGLASKKFSDGTNVHVCVKRPDWWDEKIREVHPEDITLNVQYTVPKDKKLNILEI